MVEAECGHRHGTLTQCSVMQACLSEEALEEGAGQHVPGNGVCDGREDPVQLSKRRLAVCLLARDAVNGTMPEQELDNHA